MEPGASTHRLMIDGEAAAFWQVSWLFRSRNTSSHSLEMEQ
jgi:hypothetical protein